MSWRFTFFPNMPAWGFVGGVGVAFALSAALMFWVWGRVGGYAAYWSLRQWVRKGPTPAGVPLPKQSKYLKPLADFGSGLGWVHVGLAAFWALLGFLRAFDSVAGALGDWTLAALWGVGGGYRVYFARHWGQRVTDLYNQTLTCSAELDNPGGDRVQKPPHTSGL
ncbi:hypothetical protein [Frondihabitans sp. PhB188]|uniref:hypothetical protein n=1 Tax=Frondihabitans sp. PhB188 TaxID=2485200 RepID=UPI0011CECA4A|nr:hypothetical protein [Frondihabitans sp. PhB188]